MLLLFACKEIVVESNNSKKSNGISLVLLGTVQDAGSPQIACEKLCCKNLIETNALERRIVSLGIIDSEAQETFLFDATPNITEQLRLLKQSTSWDANEIPNGIFLTHAHIGHYTGLMYLGKEASNANKVPVYAMPKMKSFLSSNGPWDQLVTNGNITLQPLHDEEEIEVTPKIKVLPFKVPHRDEYSETVGYKISGPNKSVLFIPDIDKWGKWETNIIAEITKVDYAFLDATFYDAEEINNRDISEIPHPFLVESMELFKNLPPSEKKKVHFIHFNHTNPLLNPKSEQSLKVLELGFKVARKNMVFEL